MKEIEIRGMIVDTGKKTSLKLLLNSVKVQMTIDSSANDNITDEGRLQKIKKGPRKGFG